MDREENEGNRSVVRGDERRMDLEKERYERVLRQREMESLLIPLGKKKEAGDAMEW